jgi:NitT/TauT family transport system substrate-binding protein
MNSIEFVHVDNKVLERVLIEKQVDAITSFGLGSAAVMLSKGIPSRWMLYSAAGIRDHGQTIATQTKTLEAILPSARQSPMASLRRLPIH